MEHIPLTSADKEPPPGPQGKAFAWQMCGVKATLCDMKTADLNGRVVTLSTWNDRAGRWRVADDGDARSMDVLPTKLARVKVPRRPSFVEAFTNPLWRRSTKGGLEQASVRLEPEEATRAAEEKRKWDEKTEVLTSVWVRRPSIDAHLTEEQLASERAVIVPEFARIEDEAYMQSNEFMAQLTAAERRNEPRSSCTPSYE